MPLATPAIKVSSVKHHGTGGNVTVVLHGNT